MDRRLCNWRRYNTAGVPDLRISNVLPCCVCVTKVIPRLIDPAAPPLWIPAFAGMT